MSGSARVVVDYTSGLQPGQVPGVEVVAPLAGHEQYGDYPSRAQFLAAFASTLHSSPPGPLICLVGPYGEAAVFSAASGARLDLARQSLDPNAVSVHNTGRSFLGIGAAAAAVASSGIDPAAARRWLDDGIPRTSMWVVARTEAVASCARDWHVELPSGTPAEPFVLLRVRLASRGMGGFATPQAAVAAAIERAGEPGGAVLVATGLGLGGEALAAAEPRVLLDAILPAHFAAALGDCFAFAVAPLATGA